MAPDSGVGGIQLSGRERLCLKMAESVFFCVIIINDMFSNNSAIRYCISKPAACPKWESRFMAILKGK